MAIIRGEAWKCTFAPEAVYGTAPLTAYLKNVYGIFQAVTVPDPSWEFQPVWAFGTASNRNWYRMYKGRGTWGGSVSDIWVLDGKILYLPLGTVATVGTDVALGGGSDLDEGSGTAIGDTEVTLTDASDYSVDDYIQIGETTKAEVRKITTVNTNTLTLDYPLSFAHIDAEACNEVEAPYTHTISETSELRSITQHVTYTDVAGTDILMRRYMGGKCNRMSIGASEGEMMRIATLDMLFRNHGHNISAETVYYDADIADVTPTIPEKQIFLYSYGAVSLLGSEYARIRNFSIDVDNALDPKYYVTDGATANLIQSPHEIREGRRTYRMTAQVDIAETAFYTALMEQGVSGGNMVGFDVSIVFTRGTNDTITFTMPPSTAAAGGDTQGCYIRTAPHNIVTEPVVSVTLDIDIRSMKIEIVDSDYLYVC